MKMLRVHFLNVGHGDCNIIKHPDDRLTVIDINNGAELDLESSEELAKSFRLPIYTALERLRRNRPFYINTLGVVKARQSITAYERQTLDELLRKGYNIKLTNPIEFLHTQYPFLYIHRYIQTHPDLDHMRGLAALRGEERTKVLRLYRGSTGPYYNQDESGTEGGDGIDILSPTPDIVEAANESDKTNNLSYVLRLRYKGITVI